MEIETSNLMQIAFLIALTGALLVLAIIAFATTRALIKVLKMNWREVQGIQRNYHGISNTLISRARIYDDNSVMPDGYKCGMIYNRKTKCIEFCSRPTDQHINKLFN